ncbi:hypothetical protein cyc_06710 [Cyclospora cayetanensis]|uniref:GIY-YIG domain-containing protein n=1 Tax=Cyclospora cayetanensis TaxID=88456 RepID=A0A1D3CQV6_9EIME|nr:hypothetical protein cyc_06710 [Cyclospora cayetanensis]
MEAEWIPDANSSPPASPQAADLRAVESGWHCVDRGFFSVYLLQSCSSPHHFYIGCTTNPIRRLRQHNGTLQQGARRTSSHRPWRLCLVIYGFPTLIAALQFEFRWQQALVPAAALRSLCCRGGTGAACSCSGCSSCAAKRKQLRKQQYRQGQKRRVGASLGKGEGASAAAATAAAAEWELLELQTAAADDSRCCRVPFVLTRRRSKTPQQRLEAEVQQALLLLHGAPFCRLPLHVHSCEADVTEVLQDLLLFPCCGGGARKRFGTGSSSSSGRASTRLPRQVTVSHGHVASISLQIPEIRVGDLGGSGITKSSGCSCCFGDAQSPGLQICSRLRTPAKKGADTIQKAGKLKEASSDAAPSAALPNPAGNSGCAFCMHSFKPRERALICPLCGSYVHVACAGRFALEREAAAAREQRRWRSTTSTARGARPSSSSAGLAEDNADEDYRLVPEKWWCCCCPRSVYWGFMLNHLFERCSSSCCSVNEFSAPPAVAAGAASASDVSCEQPVNGDASKSHSAGSNEDTATKAIDSAEGWPAVANITPEASPCTPRVPGKRKAAPAESTHPLGAEYGMAAAPDAMDSPVLHCIAGSGGSSPEHPQDAYGFSRGVRLAETHTSGSSRGGSKVNLLQVPPLLERLRLLGAGGASKRVVPPRGSP